MIRNGDVVAFLLDVFKAEVIAYTGSASGYKITNVILETDAVLVKHAICAKTITLR